MNVAVAVFKFSDSPQISWSNKLSIESEINTVKPVLSGHLKLDKTKVFKTNGTLMKVESIAKCSLRAFCNTFDLL